ncbi:MAG: WD40 repeat domain-containing protein [Chloroflexia bacterium]|nr:WD40 repeat domain-containing protein [Chloroflexia bacterium]
MFFSKVEFSPVDQILAIVGGDRSGQPTGQYIHFWDFETSEFLGQIKYEGHLLDLTFSPDGSMLATYHEVRESPAPNVAHLWDIETILESPNNHTDGC